jgi:flagellar L-ring protein precursor FlgH
MMNRTIMSLLLCLAFSQLLNGCSITPSTIVQKPETPRVAAVRPDTRTEGAIFNSGGYRPLFEDRRPRYVGDMVTVLITENTTANKATDNEQTKDGATTAGVTGLFGHNVPKASFNASSALSFKDKATADASNTFSGSVTATVVDVLPNGYLVISGEKQIGFDKGTEYVRFSGVVNPDMITIGNQVVSTKVADARIEYRTNSKMDAAEVLSMFSRFFLSMIPL